MPIVQWSLSPFFYFLFLLRTFQQPHLLHSSHQRREKEREERKKAGWALTASGQFLILSLSYSQFSFLGFRFLKKKEQRFLFLASIPVECCSRFNFWSGFSLFHLIWDVVYILLESPKGKSWWRSAFTVQHYHVRCPTAVRPPPHHQIGSDRLVLLHFFFFFSDSTLL